MLKKIIDSAKKNIGLILIIAFYLVMVFYHFASQGLINWDEAYFVTVVDTFSKIIKTSIFHTQEIFNGNFFQNLTNNYGNIYTAARPSYIVPAIFINLIWDSEFSTRIISAISGLLIVVFFYKILNFYNLGKRTKIGATFLMAASPLFLIYSRIGLSQIFSAAFLIICSYYFLKYNQSAEKKYLRNAALALSIFGMSHYNTFPVAGILFCFGIFIIFKKESTLKNYLKYLFYILVIPATWEIITRVGVFIASLKNISGGVVYSYSQEIIKQFFAAGGESSFKLDQVLYYPKILTSTEGFVFSILFITGLAIILKHIKKINYLIILLPAFAHLLIFSLAFLKFPRNIITILPGLYIISAIGLGGLVSLFVKKYKSKIKYLPLLIFVLFVLLINSSQYNNLLNIKTGFHETAEYIKNNYSSEKIVIFSSSAPVWRTYLKGYRVENVKEINLLASNYSGREMIFIYDYFTEINDEESYLENFSLQTVAENKTNIFKARPIILDFIYKEESYIKKLFVDKKNRVIIKELSPLKK